MVGPQSYQNINEIIKNLETRKNIKKINSTEFNVKIDELNLVKNNNSKVSSFITIQEGCDKFCKFVLFLILVGTSRSLKIISEANQVVNNGSKKLHYLDKTLMYQV